MGAAELQDRPFVTDETAVEVETWADPVRGRISFRTLSGSGDPPTRGLTTGVARLAQDGWLGDHHHTAPEVYTVLSGTGLVVLDGQQHPLGPGSTVYIPGGAVHSVRNDGTAELAVFYALAADAMDDVVYHWVQVPAAPA